MEKKKMRAMLGALSCLFCIVLLLVSVVIDSSSQGSVRMIPVTENLHGKSSRGPKAHRLNTDLFRGSKRRVPNGPDPIHNRRAGKSGRPPGRA